MAFLDYAGSDGILAASIDKAVPGTFSYILYGVGAALVISLMSRSRSLGEKPSEALMYFLGLGLVSFLLFKSVWAWSSIFVLMLLVQTFGGLTRLSTEFGSRAERKLEKEEGIDPSVEKRLINLERHAEHQKGEGELGKDAAKSGSDMATFEERTIEELGKEKTMLAGAKAISESIAEESDASRSVANRDTQILNDIQNLDAMLKGVNSAAVIDEKGRAILAQYVDRITGDFKVLAQAGKYETVAVKRTTLRIKLVQHLVDKAVKEAKELAKNQRNIAAKLRRDESKQIGAMRASVRNKIRRLGTVVSKTTDNTQKKSLEQQINQSKDQRKKLGEFNTKLKQTAKKVRKYMAAVLITLRDISKLDNEATKIAALITKRPVRFASDEKAIIDAYKTLQSAVDRSKNGETVEEIPVVAAQQTTNFFAALGQLFNTSLEFHSKELQPYIQKILQTTSKGKELDRSYYYTLRMAEALVKALEELDAMCLALSEDKNVQDSIRESKKKIEAVNPSAKSEADAKKIFGTYNEIEQKLKEHAQMLDMVIKELTTENAKLEQTKKDTVDALSRVLQTILRNKSRLNADFAKQANIIQGNFAKAQQAATTAQRAA